MPGESPQHCSDPLIYGLGRVSHSTNANESDSELMSTAPRGTSPRLSLGYKTGHAVEETEQQIEAKFAGYHLKTHISISTSPTHLCLTTSHLNMVLSSADVPFPSLTSKWHTTSYPSINPTKPSLTARGKTVFITGGGSGIGARTVQSFAQAGAAHIGILGRTEKRLLDTQQAINAKYPDVKV